ncbi:preprotein translocase subunit SecG [Helicobacter sp. 23-1048]
MANTLLVIQIVLTIFITIVVLLQKSSSIGLGAYSGSNESMFGAKGPAGFLAKATLFLGLLFIANTIALAYIHNKQTSVTDRLDSTIPSTLQPSAGQEAEDALKVTDEFNPFSQDSQNQAPSAPTAPSAP